MDGGGVEQAQPAPTPTAPASAEGGGGPTAGPAASPTAAPVAAATEEPIEKHRTWREARTEREKPFDQLYGDVIAEAKKLLPSDSSKDTDEQKALRGALNEDSYINTLDEDHYDPETGNYVRPDGTPENYNHHAKTIIDAVEAAGTGGEALRKLNPRLNRSIIDDEGRQGYAIDKRAVGSDRDILLGNKEQGITGCLDIFARVLREAVDKKLSETNPQLYHALCTELTVLYNASMGRSELPNEVLIQLTNEVFVQIQEAVDKGLLPNIEGVIPGYSGLRAQTTIKNNQYKEEDTRLGRNPNRMASWLVKNMKDRGVKHNGKEIDEQVASELVQSLGENGLSILTTFELSSANFAELRDTAVGKLLSKAGFESFLFNLSARTAGADMQPIVNLFREIAQDLSSLRAMMKSIYGSEKGMTAEVAEWIGSKLGLTKEEVDARFKKQGIDISKIAMLGGVGFMTIYGLLGPMISEGEEK